MADVTVYENGGYLTEAEISLLWERVATAYLRLQEERNGKRVKVAEAVDAVLAKHPGEYSSAVARAEVRDKGFEEYLASRRKDHLIRQVVPSLMAAEMGSRVGEKALAMLLDRLENGEDIATRDLLAIAKAGYEMVGKADKTVEEVTGVQKVQVNLDVKGLLLGMSPELAQEAVRRMLVEGK